MRHIIIIAALITTTATAQDYGTIPLNLATPLVQTTSVSTVTIYPQRDIVGIARPWIDPMGQWGRKIDARSFVVDFDGVFVHQLMTTGLLTDIKTALEGDIEITAADMAASMTALGYETWAGGEAEFRTTIHAVMHKIASVCGQPPQWADQYFAALEAQIMAQIGAGQ
jgi:hypothetical protein